MTSTRSQTLLQYHNEGPQGLDGIVTGLSRLPRMLIDILLTWQRRADERDRLASLDRRLLSDLGISEAAAAHEEFASTNTRWPSWSRE